MAAFLLYRNQIIAAAAATVGAFGLGTVLGYSSPAMPSLAREGNDTNQALKPMSDEIKSWIGSIINLGALLSAIVVGMLIDIIGRKMTMLLLSAPFVLGWLLIAFAKNHLMIIVGRTMTGFCGGGFSLAAPIFVAEMADDRVRGALGTCYQIMITGGVLFSYVVGTFLSWRWLAIVNGFIPLVFLVAMIFIPDSPRFLVAVGRTAEANKALCWFRRKTSSEDVEEEMKILEDSVNAHKGERSSFRDLLLPYYFRPAALMVGLMAFQQLSGVNAVIFYSTGIFDSAGSDIRNDVSGIIVMSVQFVATVLSAFLVDRIGRKILLLISASVMCASLIALGVLNHFKDELNMENTGWFSAVSLMIFMAAYGVGYGPIPLILLGELIPQKVKARSASLAIIVIWLISFLVTKFFDPIQYHVTVQWFYWLFAMFCAVNFVLVLIFLPETKGKSVGEIERGFGVPEWTPPDPDNMQQEEEDSFDKSKLHF